MGFALLSGPRFLMGCGALGPQDGRNHFYIFVVFTYWLLGVLGMDQDPTRSLQDLLEGLFSLLKHIKNVLFPSVDMAPH